jgi:hypothetical protein
MPGLVMTVLKGSQGSGRATLFSIVLVFASSTLGHAATPASKADDAYLNHLQGSWVMDGAYGGKPARYRADGQRVLKGGFLKLHMIDAATPPQYEADLFLGFDPKANDYIAHWLDNFGAAGARVVARGERQGQTLTITFPYAEGAFRDTFTWQPAAKSWSLLMETQGSDAAWKTIANFTLTRPAPH